MRKLAALVLLSLSLAASRAAQAADLYDYGSVAELKGVTRFYVDTGTDLDLRNIIKSRLEQLDGVKVVDRPEEAEHWVVFRSPDGHWARTIVITHGETARPRLLFTDRSSEKDITDVADDGGRAVAKAYRAVNGKKE